MLTVALVVARDGHERQVACEKRDLLIVVVPICQKPAACQRGGVKRGTASCLLQSDAKSMYYTVVALLVIV